MKIIRFVIPLLITSSLIYFLSNSLSLGGSSIPPLGHFLNPFEGFWQNAESTENENVEETIYLDGALDNVEIVFDKNHVPHIFAQNDHDLYLAQGYVIAKLRLWQLEFQTHAAAGRISELIGENGIRFDRLQRRKGMVFGASKSLEAMKSDPEIFKIIASYAQGVNLYINSLDYKDLPIEYKLLNYSPETWTPLKTALIQQYMIDNLTGWDCDLENTNALQVFGEENFNFLFPEWVEGIEPVVPSDTTWAFEPSPTSVISQPIAIAGVTPSTIEMPDPDNGSNNWAVSGKKTKSGKPMLANDMHLGLNLPSLWVVMQLNAPGVNVIGNTFTGSPGIVQGFNSSVAWAFTNSPRDVRDWYNITFKNQSKNEYLYDSAWKSTTKVIEEIKVKNGSTYIDTVTYTHHGPVVYDNSFMSTSSSENNYSLRWIGHEPSRLINALYILNRARSHEDYKKALTFWDAPAQNIAFVSGDGEIAITAQGRFPLKSKGQGKFLMDGSNPAHEWQGYIPMEHNAYQYNPKREFVSSANQHAVDSRYPYYFYNGSNEYYRNRRINALLDSLNNITVEDFMTMQQDTYSIKAQEVLPLFLDSLYQTSLSDNEKRFVQKLSEWNYYYSANLDTPILFELWWTNFKNILWDEFDRTDLVLLQPNDFNTTHIIKNYPNHKFIDVAETPELENLTQIINGSFKLAIENMVKWEDQNDSETTWANYKGTGITHLARIPAFSKSNVQTGGNGNTINAMKSNWGPSQRLIVEMTDPPTAWFVYAGGQSGNPGSPYYDNYIDKWRDGQYMELILMPSSESHQDQLKNKITIQPK